MELTQLPVSRSGTEGKLLNAGHRNARVRVLLEESDMQRARQHGTNVGRLCGPMAFAFAAAVHAHGAFAQTADIRLVALPSASASDTLTTLPTSSTQLLNDASFVVEMWAQTTHANGLSSVSADVAFTSALASVNNITHSATFNVLTSGTINNTNGTIDNLSGSHLGPCSDAVGMSPNWARVAILNMTASASGTLVVQTAPAGSPIYGTAICGVGNLADAQIVFGSVSVDLVECLVTADCDDGQYCNGAETCNPTTSTCQTGTPPACNDGFACTTDTCDPQANGGAGACVYTPNHALCNDGQFCNGGETCAPSDPNADSFGCVEGTPPTCNDDIACTTDTCDPQANGGAGACVYTSNHAFCNDGQYCNGAETCQPGNPGANSLGCVAGTPPTCNDSIDCTTDSCDPLANGGAGGCVYIPNHAYCADLVACTDDACDQLAGPGTGCSNAPNDANCDNLLFCDGVETCDTIQGCLDGVEPCMAECEHCVESAHTCELCILDLDGSGVMGTGDFSFFAPCFGACYPTGDPCLASNFDEDVGGCIGTADFAAFVGCFGFACGQCPGCAGPSGGGALASAAGLFDELDPSAVDVQLIARRAPSTSDIVEALPRSEAVFTVGERVYLEVWTSNHGGGQPQGTGLASAYVDLQFGERRLVALEVIPSDVFGLFASESINPVDGVLRAVGGCTQLDSNGVGADGNWVRVTTVVTRAVTPGRTRIAVGSSDELHGFSRVGMFENLESSLVDFNGVTVDVQKKIRRIRSER